MYETLKKEFRTKKFRTNMVEKLGGICVNCNNTNNIHYHHIIPLCKGGTNNITNIVPLCEDCHGIVHNTSTFENLRVGKAIARTKPGYKDGRPNKYTVDELEHAMKLKYKGYSYTKIVDMTGISKSTLIRYKRLKEQEDAQ